VSVADPTSWLALEPGWRVVTADGEELGKVDEVLGEKTLDIFDGLTVAGGLLAKPKYVPAELVDRIDTEAVHLTISAAETERLGEYEPPGAAD
jgi:hypothetical protein